MGEAKYRVLVTSKSNEVVELKIGERTRTFRGEVVTLTHVDARRVYLQFDGRESSQEYYPSVIFAEIYPASGGLNNG